MRKNFYFLFFIGILILSAPAFGQKNVVVVEPDDPLNPGALNRAIEAVDSLERGNTIFELKRDGLYLINGSLAHSGYTLHIRGQEGSGSKPVLQPAVDELGASSRLFSPSGSLILEHVYLQGRDELGAIENQPIRVLSDSLHITIDDCVLDYSNQSLVRTNSSGNIVMVMNSILRNCLRPDNPSNGRVIDTRGNPNDTLWISNNTIYNNGATQLRSDDGFIKFANFDHNTVYQTSFNHNFAMDIMLKVNVTNNIFYNFLYRGGSHNHDAFFRCDSAKDSYGGVLTDADRYFDLSNNNWFTQDTIGGILDEFGPDTLFDFHDWDAAEVDTLWYREIKRMNWFANDSLLADTPPEYLPDLLKFIENGQVDTSGLFREELTFENPPPLNLDYWKFYTENGWSIGGTNPPNPFGDEDPLVMGEVQEGAFDFSYNADSRSATAADGGLPLGASIWMAPPVSAKDIKVNKDFAVKTFPNPFDNEVTFNIDTKEASTMKIQIFDLLGKELHAVYKTVEQGNNEVNVNLEKISHSGLLLYQIQFETRSGLKSISSGKIIKK